ncbi:MAG: FAD binding domain-containing protein [Chloroflexi bacterium]|nr:FAD binding domain-containing protein [Chloroflexota bacterium]
MYTSYYSPTTLAEALALKADLRDRARIIAGGTDLLLEMERGARRAPDGGAPALIDLTRIPGLAEIREEDGRIQLGPLVTHNQCAASLLIVQKAFPLARACWEVGAPQIRNRATVAGNVITASPANDSIVPLLALDAAVTLTSAERGARTLPLADFMTAFRRVDMADDEILTGISLRALAENERGSFIKLGLRRAQAISVVSVAVVLTLTPGPSPSEGEGSVALAPSVGEGRCGGSAPFPTVGEGRDGGSAPSPVLGEGWGGGLAAASIALGAVTPVVTRAEAAEAFLIGKMLTDDVIAEAARLAVTAASPIDDIRASADYRRAMVETLTARLLRQLRDGRERDGWSDKPVTLWGGTGGKWPVGAGRQTADGGRRTAKYAIVNGKSVELPGQMTLLDSLRAAGYVGVKEGCAEGECGACTVFLDGMAVMACLVPAERAAGSVVVTVEGLSEGEQLHPIQAALARSGGVQCGYCTPGFVMSGAKLLEERPHPSRDEAAQALTGNLCRCTGYRKILDALVAAGAGHTTEVE